ncbi:hypothetical protein GILI108418_16805 [Gillisia limnaea]
MAENNMAELVRDIPSSFGYLDYNFASGNRGV